MVFLLSEYHARKAVADTAERETGAHHTSVQRRQQHPFFPSVSKARKETFGVTAPQIATAGIVPD
jgi:hypothetical protein